ncbi:hypothetical protein GobsT_40980 [Gemmata obscuriglobus]|uniref:hypothetical protein n=1 Tax=Gemmata obscuriglobus TaxID=114 RepID=UPI0011CCEEDA|nr:hypothetical protein [Gemmata obscuriglobus]QEG29303.1 hypothetical protein GobsT_40980 [Gemmata obscuriglobus]VTS08279.1 unnamed protein product [Gemmata obscuriglobus UQM 2246]
MPAVFPCLGPVDTYIKKPADSAWRYLGTCERSPEWEATDSFLPVYNDLGGRSLATDYVRDRRQEIVTLTLNRFNWNTYNVLRRGSPQVTNSPIDYTDFQTDHGTLTIGKTDFQLLMTFAFGGTAFSGDPAIPRGRLYYSAIPRRSSESSAGTRTHSVSILFECNGVFDPATRAFPLFTEDGGKFGSFTPE